MAENNQLEKLRGEDNWPTWQILIKSILECEDVYGVIDGSIREPEEGSANFEEKMKEWVLKNNKAKRRLLFSLETKPLLRVGGCKTARDIWLKLKATYDTQCTENLDLLRHKFHNICWDRRSGVQGLLAEFDEIQTKLGLLNAGIPEDDVVLGFFKCYRKSLTTYT